MHPTQLSDDELLQDCLVERTKASGPGGQHRNKVETAIVIKYIPTGVSAQASERRSQHENKAVALDRLRLQLALHHRTERDEQPSELWLSRIRGGKVAVSPSHRDFAILLAEALDCVVKNRFDISTAAKQLRVSTSQLIKFLKVEPAALQWVNEERKKLELHKLK